MYRFLFKSRSQRLLLKNESNVEQVKAESPSLADVRLDSPTTTNKSDGKGCNNDGSSIRSTKKSKTQALRQGTKKILSRFRKFSKSSKSSTMAEESQNSPTPLASPPHGTATMSDIFVPSSSSPPPILSFSYSLATTSSFDGMSSVKELRNDGLDDVTTTDTSSASSFNPSSPVSNVQILESGTSPTPSMTENKPNIVSNHSKFASSSTDRVPILDESLSFPMLLTVEDDLYNDDNTEENDRNKKSSHTLLDVNRKGAFHGICSQPCQGQETCVIL
jgi:hypothetical protein